KTIETIQQTTQLENTLDPIRSLEIENADKVLDRIEQDFAAYSAILQETLAQEQEQKAVELAQRQEDAKTAETPHERFFAEWEAKLLLSQKIKSELEPYLIGLQKDLAEQEKRLKAEQDELPVLRDYLKRTGVFGQAGDRIKMTIRQLKQRKHLLNRPFRPGFNQTTEDYRTRRFLIDDILFDLQDKWNAEYQAAAGSLEGATKTEFEGKTTSFLNDFRNALRDEKTLLTDVINTSQQISTIFSARMDNVNEMDRIIRTRVFWIRDGAPLYTDFFQNTKAGFLKLSEWMQTAFNEESIAELKLKLFNQTVLLNVLLLVFALPALLIALRRRIRLRLQALNQYTQTQGESFRVKVAAIFTAIAVVGINPLYLWIMGNYIQTYTLPSSLHLIAAVTMKHYAFLLFLFFLSRALFNHGSLAEAQFGMPASAARAIHNAILISLFGYLVFFIPWAILYSPPLELEFLARLCYTLFEIITGFSLVWLIRPKSEFVRHINASISSSSLQRNWSVIRILLSILIILIVVLDIIGFRYAARGLSFSLLQTGLILLILPPLYFAIVSSLESITKRRRRFRSQADAAEQEVQTAAVTRLKKFFRLVFILTAVLLIANFWGLDDQAFKTLDEFNVYSVTTADGSIVYVTIADFIRFIFYIIVMVLFLQNLPGIYEVTIFPRVKMDDGLKYAILTISRYSIFSIGIILALSQIHLDLGRLSWLMAALGVGLGFGLQEIVSNFVSGIILLVERPIQVGDIVTVGTMSGTVKRINIRATTILDFNRREVVLPNKSLITSEVTNWTRGDTIQRIVINIGVAYGTDVDLVSSLLLQIAKEQPEVMRNPEPSVFFMNHGESSLDFELRFFVPNPDYMMSLRDRINKLINKEFKKHNIEIPFPQRDIHIRTAVEKTLKGQD
ncbi:MAG: mechanosensitive ion channel, partial [bacterium]|nr:mechanosensitive ion channel [bacterium]